MKVYGFLEKAQMENVSADLSNTLLGLFWYNTTDNKMRIYDGAVRSMVSEDGAATLTNKIFSGGTITGAAISGGTLSGIDINLGTATDSNKLVVSQETKANLDGLTREQGSIYFASDEKKYYGDDGFNLVDLGGGGAGGINYVSNPDAETDANGHTAYKDSVSEVPDDATGGSPTLAVTRSTVSPLVDTASFLISKPASNTQGEGVAISNEDFNEADKGKIHIMSFEYDASDANYNDGDFRVYFKDETNGVILRVNGEDIKAGKGTHYARIQVPIDCDNGSLVIHCAATHADAIAFKYDRISVGPQILAYGGVQVQSAYADGGSTGSAGVVSNYTIQEQSGSGLLSYASGVWTVLKDNVKVTAGASGAVNTSDSRMGVYFTINSTKRRMAEDSFDSAAGYRSSASASQVLNKGDTVTFESAGAGNLSQVEISISAVAHNGLLSQDFGGRDIYVVGRGNSGAAITANTERIDWTTIKDSSASWSQTDSNGNDTFTAPESGQFIVVGKVASNSNTANRVFLYKNNVFYQELVDYQTFNVTDSYEFKTIVDLNKDDTIDFRLEVGITLDNTATDHWIHIQKLASSQQILETEKVEALYETNSGQAITGSPSTMIFEDRLFDSHNFYNPLTGIGIAPYTGKYLINTKLLIDQDSNWNVNEIGLLQVNVNGSLYKYMNRRMLEATPGSAYYMDLLGTIVVELNKGDTFEIVAQQTSGVTQNILNAATQNYLSIVRL